MCESARLRFSVVDERKRESQTSTKFSSNKNKNLLRENPMLCFVDLLCVNMNMRLLYHTHSNESDLVVAMLLILAHTHEIWGFFGSHQCITQILA